MLLLVLHPAAGLYRAAGGILAGCRGFFSVLLEVFLRAAGGFSSVLLGGFQRAARGCVTCCGRCCYVLPIISVLLIVILQHVQA